jgi:ketosteroid isomerase-like protein
MATDANEILALETAAMERWCKGDPDGYLEIYDEGIVYFDPFVERRLNGLDAMRDWYGTLRGKVHIDSFEFLDPQVASDGTMAVLTFNYLSHTGQNTDRWNVTEVYRRQAKGWRITQSHWSHTQPKLADR